MSLVLIGAELKIILEDISREDFLWLTEEIESNLKMLDTGTGQLIDEITKKEIIDE